MVVKMSRGQYTEGNMASGHDRTIINGQILPVFAAIQVCSAVTQDLLDRLAWIVACPFQLDQLGACVGVVPSHKVHVRVPVPAGITDA